MRFERVAELSNSGLKTMFPPLDVRPTFRNPRPLHNREDLPFWTLVSAYVYASEQRGVRRRLPILWELM